MSSILRLRSSTTLTLASGTSSLITLIAVIWATHSTCNAASPFQPAGLNPGDQYRLIFMTSGTIVPSTTSLSVYNNFVNTQAGLSGSLVSGLSTTWTAIVSNTATGARTNTNSDPTPNGLTGVPIYLVNGATRIADNYDDLWDGAIAAPVGLTQFATVPTGGLIDNMAWTGTNQDGTPSIGFQAFTMGTGSIVAGFGSETSNYWVSASLIGVSSDPHYAGHLYALSGVLTVVPEPTSGSLLAAFFLLIGANRRRFRGAAPKG